MEGYVDYINRSLPQGKESRTLYDYKNHLIEEMGKRANELEARGLKDRKVSSDLIISEYPNIGAQFADYNNKKQTSNKSGRALLLNILLSAAYIILLVTVYLGVSFATHRWGQTWVLLADGAMLLGVYYFFLAANKFAGMRRIFHLFARLFMMADVMTLTVCVFLFALAVLHLPKSWLILIFGVAIVLFADGVFASIMREPLVIFSWLAYVPAIATMVFIVVCAAGIVPWSVGWIMIPLSLLIDIALIIIRIADNSKRREEVQDPWKES